jgi:hypothetical protein
MGIRFFCPNGHKLNVKEFQAGRRGICPFCGAKILIPTHSTRPASRRAKKKGAEPEEGEAPSGEEFEAVESPVPSPPVPSQASTSPGAAETGVATGEVVSSPGQPPVSGSLPRQPQRAAATAASPDAKPPSRGPADASTTNWSPAAAIDQESVDMPGVPQNQPAASAASVDPIAEAPDAIWYVRPPTGGQFGPAAGDVMRGWLAEGRVSANSLVWREGWKDWTEAGVVFAQLHAGAAALFTPDRDEPIRVTTPSSHRTKGRSATDASQFTLILVLSIAVIVLIFVFVYVLVGQ